MVNFIDGVIRYVSPVAAVKREQARLALGVIDKHKARRFDGASKSSRFTQWKRPGTSADSALIANAALLRNGSRDLTRNNPWAERALTVIESNTVGTGITAQVVVKQKGRAKALNTLWWDWAMTTSIDAEERLDLIGLENLIIRTIAESGEVLVRRRFRRQSDNLPIPVQLQVLEPDYLDSSKDGALANGGEIKNGIEFDKRGKRVAYWLFESHPGDASGYRFNYQSYRIPASDVIHAFDPKRAGQSRGYPWVAAAIRRLKDFDDYEDAQLVRQKIAACFTGFIHDMNIAGAGTGATGLDKAGPTENQLEYLQPGVFEHLPPGKDIKFPQPPGVENYDEYTRNILRGVAAAYGITYEALTGDYSNVNFSSGRMGWIEMGRNIHRWQNTIMRVQVLERIARWFFAGAGMQGLDTTDAYIKWTYPRREMIDPTKEIPAMGKAIRLGLTSLTRTHASLGYDSEEIFDEIAESNKILDEKGLILDSDPRRVNVSGSLNADAEKTTPEDEPPPEDQN